MDKLDSILKKVTILYGDLGLDVDDMSDVELARICKYYLTNPDQLEMDMLRSKEIYNKFIKEKNN